MQIKYQENPFHSQDKLHTGKSDFMLYDLPNSPVPVYLDMEMKSLVTNATIDMEKVGMYRFLSLVY